MSDTTETDNTDTETDTDEPSKTELHERVEQLESTVEKMMPSRRDALKLGAAGIAGAAGLSATSQSAAASTGSAGQIGDSNNRPDVFADTVDTNNLTGVSTGGDRQGCRVFLSFNQSITAGGAKKIQFNQITYDSGNNFDTGPSEWICPEDGLYAVNLQVRFVGGSGGDTREAVIANSSTGNPSGEGISQKQSLDPFDRLSLSTVNRYNSGDSIAAYAKNENSADTVGGSGDSVLKSAFEVAFLGGL